jgi:hypothetical protein
MVSMDEVTFKKLDDYLRTEFLAGRITIERLQEIADDRDLLPRELVKKYPELAKVLGAT